MTISPELRDAAEQFVDGLLTEKRVREIVREEIAKALAEATKRGSYDK